jgi:hypothetical protein
MSLRLEPNFHDPENPSPYPYMAADAFYAELLGAHEGLDPRAQEMFEAKLILILANHIGDLRVLRQAMQAARDHLVEALPVPKPRPATTSA